MWDRSSKTEESWTRKFFTISQVAPLTWNADEKHIGLIVHRNTKKESYAIVWNMEEGKLLANQKVSKSALLISAGNKLLIRDEEYLRDIETGLVVNSWSDLNSSQVL